MREVYLRDGLDTQQTCCVLLFEFCHYQQAKQLGGECQRNLDGNFIAFCGGYVLARRFGVDVGGMPFQKEVFPVLTAETRPERAGVVKNYLSQIICTIGAVTCEIQRGIYEMERDCGQIVEQSRQESADIAI